MRAKKPHQAYTFRCELSEGLAFKYFITCHLNQAYRQYVDSDALADKFFASSYSPSVVSAIIPIFQVQVKTTDIAVTN
ncbi:MULTISPECIES: hypothetical protein [Nostoc]|uniref:Uncharacterized protein n=1 Tax=Nostoc paludosum FACHB-159 TaxID=2692908 RepID=A0ABR8K796_9NOSO|nr:MULTISPECIES: hypothetical protein [Nostoc]MBD2678622.1 hypothetical protein [Nostoc sp. FACHB-857]MBD2734671.1 hypothetical protein [Nostoc paludosum FACHB-159]